jgi:very-short-patch-repair endonuclease
MTVEETRLWLDLRKDQLGVRFRRQVPVGPYIVDFACLPLRLIVEVDGSHHRGEDDRRRDAWLRYRGFTILRFWNDEVYRDLAGVVARITEEVERSSPRRKGKTGLEKL